MKATEFQIGVEKGKVIALFWRIDEPTRRFGRFIKKVNDQFRYMWE